MHEQVAGALVEQRDVLDGEHDRCLVEPEHGLEIPEHREIGCCGVDAAELVERLREKLGQRAVRDPARRIRARDPNAPPPPTAQLGHDPFAQARLPDPRGARQQDRAGGRVLRELERSGDLGRSADQRCVGSPLPHLVRLTSKSLITDHYVRTKAPTT